MRNRTTLSLATMLVAGQLAAVGISGCVVTREREIVTTRNLPVTREVHEEVVVQRPAMPAPRVEVRTIQPAPTYHWVDGSWQWGGSAWEWSPGYWAP